jgi:hypothetical protein
MARRYSRTGIYALKKRGLEAVDKRSAGYRALMAMRQQLIADQGGPAEMSEARTLITDYVVVNHAIIEQMTEALLAEKNIVDPKTKVVLPLARERQSLVNANVQALKELGLERRRVRVPSLEEARAQAERVA